MTTVGSITAIVHGTAPGNWWRPGQPFPSAVASVVNDLYSGSDCFRWTGGNSDADRRQAAQDLLNWVEQHLRPNGFLRLICHSHGGSVAFLATRLGLRVQHLILLGTPIRTDYLPDMRNIERLDNIYVPWDPVQDLGCYEPFRPFRAMDRHRGEGRTLADTDKILNHPVIQGVTWRSAHGQLHDWNVWCQNGLDQVLP